MTGTWEERAAEQVRRYINFRYSLTDTPEVEQSYILTKHGSTSTDWEKKVIFLSELDGVRYHATVTKKGMGELITVDPCDDTSGGSDNGDFTEEHA
jgi:hypothetical protein